MKKTIKKNWLKALIISVSLLLINCSVEEEVISGSHFGPQNKKFTYSDFLKETKAKDFDIFAKYNVSRSKNGVMQKSIQQDFITDTTEIKRLEIPNTDKTTYSFKIYPLTEQLNSKEYFNMVVEKNGNQLTYMVFFNKDKLNPSPTESKMESSQMVYNSRNTHNGFVEVVTVDRNCRGSKCTGACDLCDECTTTTVSYVYVGNQTQIIAPNGNNTTGGTGSYNGGYIEGPFNGLYIPNPYDGLDDPSNPLFQMAGNINAFLNSLPQDLKNIATSPGMFSYSHVYFQQNGLNTTTQEKYTNALINFKNFTNNFNPSDITNESFLNFKFWSFNVFLENNIENNAKVFNIKNFIKNTNIDTGTKEKIIDELATKNNQEILDFVSQFAVNTITSGLNLDFEKSLKSPANIDFSAINQTTPEGQHFTWIYGKLMESPKFKEMFTNTFKENVKLNVKFEIAENLGVNGNCRLSPTSQGGINITIKISKSLFGVYSNMNIAKTILHECIHAYLGVKKLNSNLGTTITELNNLNLTELLGTYSVGFGGIVIEGHNVDSHNFMFNYMIPVFKSILGDLKSGLVAQDSINYLEQQSWNLSDGTTYNFNWQDAYYFLSLLGLQNSSAFQTEFPDGSINKEKFDFLTSFLIANLTKIQF